MDKNSNIEIYSTHNETKLAVVERYIRTSKNNIWQLNEKNVCRIWNSAII